MIRRLLERLRARVRPAPVAPAVSSPAAPHAIPTTARLRLVPLPPQDGGPAGLVFLRGGEALVLDYAEVLLLSSELPRLLDALARFSPHYAPADVPLPAEPPN